MSFEEEVLKITMMPMEKSAEFWDSYYGIMDTVTEYENAGYALRSDSGKLCLIPINALTALELYKKSNCGEIYRLYDDGTEAAVEDLYDLLAHAKDGGVFGLETTY